MKRLAFAVFASSLLAAGCANMDAAGDSAAAARAASASPPVTGSRLPRSESLENYQGAKTMGRRDYEEYKASTSLKGGG